MPTASYKHAFYRDDIDDRTRTWANWDERCRSDLRMLANSIAGNSVVAYVGAGPSIASSVPGKKIPGWKDLCQSLFRSAQNDSPRRVGKRDLTYLKELIKNGNYPLFCQVVDNAYRQEKQRLDGWLKELFLVSDLEPSEAYRAIAMLPIALRFTTNYEDLLERAIRNLGPAYKRFIPNSESQTLTWKDGAKIFDLVRSGLPGVVKIHGDISSDKPRDIVLTKNHYRQLFSDTAFWDVLKALLSTRTFMFIGCSMSDPDIFALMDEVLEECHLISDSSESLPLHFALVSQRVWKPAFISHLREDYRIACLPIPVGPDRKPDLVSLLRVLSGAVSKLTQSFHRGFSPIFDSNTAREWLSEIVQCTGSDRADIVLEGRGRDLKHWFNWDYHLPTRRRETKSKSGWRDDPPPGGIIAAAYLEPVLFLYAPELPHLASQSSSLDSEGLMSGSYFAWDDYSRSELAVPIMARGIRIGVLNVESYFLNGYTEEHRDFLQKQAELLGALRLEAEERDRSVRSFSRLAQTGESGVAVLIETLRRLYSGANFLDGIFYTPNFAAGKLVGHFGSGGPPFEHPFSHPPSFANQIFQNREGVFEPRVEKLIESGSINTARAKQAGLKAGPLYGCQVFDHELQCGVLVLWYKQEDRLGRSRVCGLHRHDRRMVLATGANFVVATYKWKGNHDPEQVSLDHKWKDQLDRVFTPISKLHAASSEEKIFEQAAVAISTLGLKRLRVWQVKDGFSQIVYAWPSTYEVLGVTETWESNHKHLSHTKAPVFSDYCLRIITRYVIDPWARLQGPSVSRLGEDPVAQQVGRPPGADWIVCPIVIGLGIKKEEPKLWGYLSVDKITDQSSHLHKNDYDNEDERNWIECGLSVVAVALSSALQNIAPKIISAPNTVRLAKSHAKASAT